MRGERFTPGLAFILAGLGILFVTGAFEAEIVLTSGLGTPSYLGATDLVRLSAVPWGLGLLFFRIRNRPSRGLVGPGPRSSHPRDVPPLCGRRTPHRRHRGAR